MLLDPMMDVRRNWSAFCLRATPEMTVELALRALSTHSKDASLQRSREPKNAWKMGGEDAWMEDDHWDVDYVYKCRGKGTLTVSAA